MKNECSLGLRFVLVSGVEYQECESQMDAMLMVAAIEMTYAGYKHKLLKMFSLFFASLPIFYLFAFFFASFLSSPFCTDNTAWECKG